MTLAFVLLPLSLFWFVGCATIPQKKISQESLQKTWETSLAILNQPTTNSAFINDDLQKIYDAEMASINVLWENQRDKNLDNAKAQRQKHEFFHARITERNSASVAYQASTSLTTHDLHALAANVIAYVEAHETASTKKVFDYDDGDQIGFCFGRALLVHYLLLKAGVSQEHLVKVFALSDLMLGGQIWQFHVAMMIKNADGSIVVDPLYGAPARLDDWMSNVASLDIKKPWSRTRFYFTDPRKFMPSPGRYSVEAFSQEVIRTYFYDLGRSIQNPRASHISMTIVERLGDRT